MAVNKAILCIEDERETAELIAEDLIERGYAVALAFDGHSGIEAIRNKSPDLILCDISMPLMSGFDVLEKLSGATHPMGRIPFIFLTALADRESELKGRKLGADDYVTKPIDFEILAAIIEARLSRHSASPAAPNGARLSDRETELLTWVARGKSSSEIAEIVGLRKRTIDFHIDSAREKLGVSTRVQAVLKATSGKLIEP